MIMQFSMKRDTKKDVIYNREKVIIPKKVVFYDYNQIDSFNYELCFKDILTNDTFSIGFETQCDFKNKINDTLLISEECDFLNDSLIKCDYYNLYTKICYE